MNNNEIRAYEGGDYAQIEDSYTDRRIQVAIANRAGKVVDKVNALEDEIEEIKNSPDVVDIVPNKAALDAYDKSSLTDKDVIRVLADETHDGASTYYRYNKSTNSFTYIGTIGEYYTKSQTDNLLSAKQNTLIAGDNITITNDVISATASGGLPTNTTFWGQSYDSTNNRVDGDIYIGCSGNIIGDTTGTISTAPSIRFSVKGILMTNYTGGADYSTVQFSEGSLKLSASNSQDGTGAIILYPTSLNIANKRITSVADPTSAQDAATKKYVDTAVASAGATAFPTSTFETILENS